MSGTRTGATQAARAPLAHAQDRSRIVQNQQRQRETAAKIEAMVARDRQRDVLMRNANLAFEASLDARHAQISRRVNQQAAHSSAMEIAQFLDKLSRSAQKAPDTVESDELERTIKARARAQRRLREKELLGIRQEKARTSAFEASSKATSPGSSRPVSHVAYPASQLALTAVDELDLRPKASYDDALMKRFDGSDDSSDIDLHLPLDSLGDDLGDDTKKSESMTMTYKDHHNRSKNVADELSYLTARYAMGREDKGAGAKRTEHLTKLAENEVKRKERLYAGCKRDVDDLISLAIELAILHEEVAKPTKASIDSLWSRWTSCSTQPDIEYRERVDNLEHLVRTECELYLSDIPEGPSDIERLELKKRLVREIIDEESICMSRPGLQLPESTGSAQFVDDQLVSVLKQYRDVLPDAPERNIGDGSEPPSEEEHSSQQEKLTFVSTLNSVVKRLKTTEIYLSSRDEPYFLNTVSIPLPLSEDARLISCSRFPLVSLVFYNPNSFSEDVVADLAAETADYFGSVAICYHQISRNFSKYKTEFMTYAGIYPKLADADKQLKARKKDKDGEDPIILSLDLLDEFACVCDQKDAERIAKLISGPMKGDTPPDSFVLSLIFARICYFLRTGYGQRLVDSPILESAGKSLSLTVNIHAEADAAELMQERENSVSDSKASRKGSRSASRAAAGTASAAVSRAQSRALSRGTSVTETAASLTQGSMQSPPDRSGESNKKSERPYNSFLIFLPLRADLQPFEIETNLAPLATLRQSLCQSILNISVPSIPSPAKNTLTASIFDFIYYLSPSVQGTLRVVDDLAQSKATKGKKDQPLVADLSGVPPWDWSALEKVEFEPGDDTDYTKMVAGYSSARSYLKMCLSGLGGDTRPTSGKEAKSPGKRQQQQSTEVVGIPIIRCSKDTLRESMIRTITNFINEAKPGTPSSENANKSAMEPEKTSEPFVHEEGTIVSSDEVVEIPISDGTVIPIAPDTVHDFMEEQLTESASEYSLKGILVDAYMTTRISAMLQAASTDRQLINHACRCITQAIHEYEENLAVQAPAFAEKLRVFSLHFVNMRLECMRIGTIRHHDLLEYLQDALTSFSDVISRSETNLGATVDQNDVFLSDVATRTEEFRTILENHIHAWRQNVETFLDKDTFAQTDINVRPSIFPTAQPGQTFETEMTPGVSGLANVAEAFFYSDISGRYRYIRPMGDLFRKYSILVLNNEDSIAAAEELQKTFTDTIRKVYGDVTQSYILQIPVESTYASSPSPSGNATRSPPRSPRTTSRAGKSMAENAPDTNLHTFTEVFATVLLLAFRDIVYSSLRLFAKTFYALTNILPYLSPSLRTMTPGSALVNVRSYIKPELEYDILRDEDYTMDVFFEDFYQLLTSSLNYKNLFDISSTQSAKVLGTMGNDVALLIQLVLENYHVFLRNFVHPNGTLMMTIITTAFQQARERCDNVLCAQYLSTLESIRSILGSMDQGPHVVTFLNSLTEKVESLGSSILTREVIILQTLQSKLKRKDQPPEPNLFIIDEQNPQNNNCYWFYQKSLIGSKSSLLLPLQEFLDNIVIDDSPFASKYCLADIQDISGECPMSDTLTDEQREGYTKVIQSAAEKITWSHLFESFALECVSAARKTYDAEQAALLAPTKGKKPSVVDQPGPPPSNDFFVAWPFFLLQQSFPALNSEEFDRMVELVLSALRLDSVQFSDQILAEMALEESSSSDEKVTLFRDTGEYKLLKAYFSDVEVSGPYLALPIAEDSDNYHLNRDMPLLEFNKLYRLAILELFGSIDTHNRPTLFIAQLLSGFTYSNVRFNPLESDSNSGQTSAPESAHSSRRGESTSRSKQSELQRRLLHILGMYDSPLQNFERGYKQRYKIIREICCMGTTDCMELSIPRSFYIGDYMSGFMALRKKAISEARVAVEGLQQSVPSRPRSRTTTSSSKAKRS
ncbi:hypothetical protein GMRT_12695 [Giardia muris]|uniref:Uncharacterized protein n=1 Tax=Giardia muris TaxID=5742 RepID=A0A4Z1T4A1_GIAMU|nr:hypothetical protein GMRT_12695 [Giardia muris]|eukprot:TNJ30488.1 hypothetical protein GMRT_12695 [Giardia muris]